MRDINIAKIDETALQLYCNTRSKNYRHKGQHDIFKQTIYNFSQVLKEDYNCQPYFITVTFPIDKYQRDIEREWSQAGIFIEQFKETLSKNYLVVGGIIAVEPHKNSTLKSKRGKNSKAGSPHFHIVVWLCHQFLNPHLEKMGFALLLAGSFSKISFLPSRIDTLKAVLYATKERGSDIIGDLCRAYTSWPQNINIWSNHSETHQVFLQMEQSLNYNTQSCFISNEFYNKFPTTRCHQDKGLLLAELFAKIFDIQGLAVRDDHVYGRIPGTLYSWSRYMPLEDWVAQRFNFKAPLAYLQMLKDHTLWITKQGSLRKDQKNFKIFPNLIIQGFLVEFKDCIYNFYDGTTISLQDVKPNTATFCHVKSNFDQCRPPYTLLGLLHTLIAWGQDITKERKEVLAIPVDERKRYDLARIQHFQKSEDRFRDALQTFGGLYHPNDNRKQNPALYLCGEPSTYKTFLIRAIFDRLVGIDSVEVISRHNGRFNTGNLRKEDGQPYILVIDDMRWQHLGLHLPDFINLLDGYFVKTEKKYKTSQAGQLKGTIAITSNENVGGDREISTISTTDLNALETRLKEIQLHKIREEFVLSPLFLQQIKDEAVAFSILTNTFYLARDTESKKILRVPKSFTTLQDHVDHDASIFEKAGFEHMINIFKDFS